MRADREDLAGTTDGKIAMALTAPGWVKWPESIDPNPSFLSDFHFCGDHACHMI